ncbi:sarcosine oxidase subunit gamma [Aminobacter aminovorans]|uniref:Sarcosine oxidase, gamma subunit family n=1 Tax=Aminobacter aminovorans TaxID=83263 RepID=A0A380WID8_AMIAI|nr:sarcosine oxidase subunit gamma [Aminobacter aminovorans]TCS28681.1 sarcosine oxidase subunit gamma [Aminobacter aminovorans]SUU88535.1 sarcosine oxidase, gamma subunit family [Aminobacter aminovorans]
MAKVAIATRHPAHAGKSLGGHGVSLKVLEPASRMSLRARPAAIAALSKALGIVLPEKPKSSAAKAGRTVLWLGPDEWLVIDEAGDPVADCGSVKGLHSAVDVSHRNVGIAIVGPNAAATINAGCPQDLSLQAFPVGAASRTVLGKVEIVLLRTGEDAFRLECWRSFSDYVWGFLSEAARDA